MSDTTTASADGSRKDTATGGESTLSSTPWPPNCFARYRTVAGATVDLTEASGVFAARCTGCPQSFTTTGGHGEDYERERGEEQVRFWAQSHAAECRAIPKPGGAS